MDPSIWKRYLNRKQNTYTHIELLSMFFLHVFTSSVSYYCITFIKDLFSQKHAWTDQELYKLNMMKYQLLLSSDIFLYHIQFCNLQNHKTRMFHLPCSTTKQKNNKRPMGHIATLRNSSNQNAQLQKAMIKLIKKKKPSSPFNILNGPLNSLQQVWLKLA